MRMPWEWWNRRKERAKRIRELQRVVNAVFAAELGADGSGLSPEDKDIAIGTAMAQTVAEHDELDALQQQPLLDKADFWNVPTSDEDLWEQGNHVPPFRRILSPKGVEKLTFAVERSGSGR